MITVDPHQLRPLVQGALAASAGGQTKEWLCDRLRGFAGKLEAIVMTAETPTPPRMDLAAALDLEICTGCGHDRRAPILPPALACCPDGRYRTIRQVLRDRVTDLPGGIEMEVTWALDLLESCVTPPSTPNPNAQHGSRVPQNWVETYAAQDHWGLVIQALARDLMDMTANYGRAMKNLAALEAPPRAPMPTADDLLEGAAILKLLADGEDMADHRDDARRLAKILAMGFVGASLGDPLKPSQADTTANVLRQRLIQRIDENSHLLVQIHTLETERREAWEALGDLPVDGETLKDGIAKALARQDLELSGSHRERKPLTEPQAARPRELWMLEVRGQLDPRWWAITHQDAEDYMNDRAPWKPNENPRIVRMVEAAPEVKP